MSGAAGVSRYIGVCVSKTSHARLSHEACWRKLESKAFRCTSQNFGHRIDVPHQALRRRQACGSSTTAAQPRVHEQRRDRRSRRARRWMRVLVCAASTLSRQRLRNFRLPNRRNYLFHSR